MTKRTAALALTALTLAVVAALVAVLIWRWWMQRGTNRIEAQPASPSVSYEHMLEEADPEQLRYMREVGEL